MVIWLEQRANDLHVVELMALPPIGSCFIKILIGLAFLVPNLTRLSWKRQTPERLNQGCLGKESGAVVQRVRHLGLRSTGREFKSCSR